MRHPTLAVVGVGVKVVFHPHLVLVDPPIQTEATAGLTTADSPPAMMWDRCRRVESLWGPDRDGRHGYLTSQCRDDLCRGRLDRGTRRRDQQDRRVTPQARDVTTDKDHGTRTRAGAVGHTRDCTHDAVCGPTIPHVGHRGPSGVRGYRSDVYCAADPGVGSCIRFRCWVRRSENPASTMMATATHRARPNISMWESS